jgi:hypothetical protein
MPVPRPALQEEDYIDYIARFAIRENWGPENRFLDTYVDWNFELAHDQGLVAEAEDKSYALWRVGNLLTPDGEPITIACTRNRNPAREPYYFVRVFDKRRFILQVEGKRTPLEALGAPIYDVPAYHADYELTYQFRHYLEDHEERATAGMPTLNDHQRFLCIYAAANLAHKRREGVPQYYRDKRAPHGNYQWLLPLYINQDDVSKRPDFVATLHPIDEHREYSIRTLLPPEWAYPNARAISARDPQFRTWAAT